MKFPNHAGWHALVLAGPSLWFLCAGIYISRNLTVDLIPVYTGARCLMQGCNPYDTAQLDSQYLQSGGPMERMPQWRNIPPLYPPSTLLVLAPLTLLEYPAARLFWVILSGALFVASVWLIWSMSPKRHRWVFTALGSIFPIGATRVLAAGQPAGFAISLLVIGAILFLKNRYIPLATVLLMLSVAIKPHLSGPIVLYFVITKIHWRYAIAALSGALGLLLIGMSILTLRPASAHWTGDLAANIAAAAAPGGVNDPRPGGALNLANLQGLTSVLFANDAVFNFVAYAIFLVLLAWWLTAVVKTTPQSTDHFIALGALATLSLLPVYHRLYDAGILVLAIPAIAGVLSKHRRLGLAIFVTTGLVVTSGEIAAQIRKILGNNGMLEFVMNSKLPFVLTFRMVNLSVLLLFVLYMTAIVKNRHSPGALFRD